MSISIKFNIFVFFSKKEYFGLKFFSRIFFLYWTKIVNKRIHPAPTIKVFPGAFGKLKISSLLIPYSKAPGISGYLGRPPTAIKKYLDVKVFSPCLVTV